MIQITYCVAYISQKNRWGLTEQIKVHAQRIADNTNVLTVVPDLYKGKLGLSQEVSILIINVIFFFSIN